MPGPEPRPHSARDGAARIFGRRAVLTAAFGVGASALAACAADLGATGRPSPSETPTTGVIPDPTPTASSIVTGPAPVDPAEIAAQYSGIAPTAWGPDLDGIMQSLAAPYEADGRPRIALTFDACGGPGGGGFDGALISGLRAAAIPATLFLNSRWIEQHPDLAGQLAADPLFRLGNHGTRHLPLSVTGESAYGIPGTTTAQEAVDEVWGNHVALTRLTGHAPRYFRSGTAHYDDVAVQIVHALGETPAGFAVNGDGGATFSAGTVTEQVVTAPPGAIVIAHMNQPDGDTASGMLRAIDELRSRTSFVHLDA